MNSNSENADGALAALLGRKEDAYSIDSAPRWSGLPLDRVIPLLHPQRRSQDFSNGGAQST